MYPVNTPHTNNTSRFSVCPDYIIRSTAQFTYPLFEVKALYGSVRQRENDESRTLIVPVDITRFGRRQPNKQQAQKKKGTVSLT